MPALPPAAVLTDIEGTATPRDFVAGVLRPYAASELPGYLAARGDEDAVRAVLDDASRLVPGQDPAETLAHWMRSDAPAPPLRALQGLIWRDGFDRGALGEPVYADVAPSLRRWAKAGIRLAAYSADSAEMQRQLFAHAAGEDLTALFQGFFDTRVGLKSEPDSFSRLAIALAVPTMEVLYLSAVEAELDAAAAAGMRTCQVLRSDGGAVASERHPQAADFPAVARQLGLPSAA
jgi:enolase-phosphatase E1